MLRVMATFVRVANAGSLTAAGRDLGLSQSAVSQQIVALERHLNVRLIHRTTRQMTLTEAGLQYLHRAQGILDAVQEAAEAASGHVASLKGPLRIHAPVGLGQSHIADVAIGFQQRHPELEVDLALDDRFVDLTAQAVDVAIRLGDLVPSSHAARRIGRLRRIVVASPDYVALRGMPGDPDALRDHLQVRFNGAPTGDVLPLIGPDGPLPVHVRTVFRANNAHALTRALVAGLGLGGVQLPLVQAELERGQLIRVLPAYEYAPLDVHAVYPSAGFIPARVRAFVDFLKEETDGIW